MRTLPIIPAGKHQNANTEETNCGCYHFSDVCCWVKITETDCCHL